MDGEVARGDEQRALPRVDVGDLQRVVRRCGRSSPAAARSPGCDGCAASERYTSSSTPAGGPRTRTARPDDVPLLAAVSPGARLVVASAPALTIGFIGLPPLSSIATTELNARPVLFTPTSSSSASGPSASQTRANTNALETRLDRELVQRVADAVRGPVDRDHAQAESAGSAVGQHRDVVGDVAAVHPRVPVVRVQHGADDQLPPGHRPVETNPGSGSRRSQAPSEHTPGVGGGVLTVGRMGDDLADLRGTRFENADLHRRSVHDGRPHGRHVPGRRAAPGRDAGRGDLAHHHRRRDRGRRQSTVSTSGPLIEAELDRLYPDRPLFRPTYRRRVPATRGTWNERLWACDGGARPTAAGRRTAAHLGRRGSGRSSRPCATWRSRRSPGWVRASAPGRPDPVAPAVAAVGRDAAPARASPWDRAARPSLDEALTLRLAAMAPCAAWSTA